MKNNSISKFIILLLAILLVVFMFSPKVYATNANSAVVNASLSGALSDAEAFLEKGDLFENTISVGNLKSTSDFIYNIALAVGIVIALVIGAVLGVKFITASVEGKAQIKEALIPYIAGCVVLFGSFAIWKIAINFGKNMTRGTITDVDNSEKLEQLLLSEGDLSRLSDEDLLNWQVTMMQGDYNEETIKLREAIAKEFSERTDIISHSVGLHRVIPNGGSMYDEKYFESLHNYLDYGGSIEVFNQGETSAIAGMIINGFKNGNSYLMANKYLFEIYLLDMNYYLETKYSARSDLEYKYSFAEILEQEKFQDLRKENGIDILADWVGSHERLPENNSYIENYFDYLTKRILTGYYEEKYRTLRSLVVEKYIADEERVAAGHALTYFRYPTNNITEQEFFKRFDGYMTYGGRLDIFSKEELQALDTKLKNLIDSEENQGQINLYEKYLLKVNVFSETKYSVRYDFDWQYKTIDV